MKRQTTHALPTPLEIRTLRTQHNLTQRQAAAMLYRSKRCWQAWEYADRNMDPQLWEAFVMKCNRLLRLAKRQEAPRASRPKASDTAR